MSRGVSIAWVTLAAAIAGCATVGNDISAPTGQRLDASWFDKMTTATEPARDSLRKLTKRNRQIHPPTWNWASAVPVDVQRSQVVSAVVPGNQIARMLPDFQSGKIAPVSSPPPATNFRVTNIDGQTVRNCADLFMACERVADNLDDRHRKTVQVDLVDLNAPENSPETAIELVPRQLVDLGQMIAPDQPAMRITKDSNPWIIYREQGIRCKLMARAETNLGLLHVVLSIANSGDTPKLLPVEIQASCGAEKLKCLSVSETLETLWGNRIRNSGRGR